LESKNALEQWFNINKDNPYASDSDIALLQKYTRLEVKSIQRWLSNRRKTAKQTENLQLLHDHFTTEQTLFLNNYFNRVSFNPNKSETACLAQKLHYSEKKISAWFKRKRYLKNI
jgi:hypothetical protein